MFDKLLTNYSLLLEDANIYKWDKNIETMITTGTACDSARRGVLLKENVTWQKCNCKEER